MSHLQAALRIANAFARQHPRMRDELVQAARIAVWECDRSGVTRASLVKGRVRWALTDVLREHMWFRRAGAKRGKMPELLATHVWGDPIARLWLGVAAEDLTFREYEVIRDHYARDRSLKDIADYYGISQAAVSQMHKRALDKMRNALSQTQLDRHADERR